MSNVTLDGKVLQEWTSCLTNNFVPNYQKIVNSNSFVDFVAKYANEKRLLTEKKMSSIDFKAPAIYIGEFNAPEGEYDTFLNPEKFKKVIYFI